MKKIMLSSVILLPLVILLILTIGTVVVGVTNHIYVETVAFREVDTLVLVKDANDSVPSAKPEVNVFPLTASNTELVYTSGDESVVTVDPDGTVRGVDFGETYIYAASKENSSISASRRVLVTDTRAHRVEIENAPAVLYEGQRLTLSAGVYPKEAENTALQWSSSDPSVLSVSPDGTLTFRSPGTASVTAACVSDPSVCVTAEIRCKRPVSGIDTGGVTSVVTALSEAQFPVVHFSPAGAEEKIVYSVSDDSVASVDETGKITFRKAGEVYVAARATDGLGNTVSVEVKYLYTAGKYRNVWFERGGERIDSLAVDFDEYSGKDLGLSLCGSPSDVTDVSAAVDVAFSDPDKMEYRDGKFYATGTGTVFVTVTVHEYTGGTSQVRLNVNIARKVSSVAFPGADGNSVTVTQPNFDVFGVMDVQPSGANVGYTEALRFTSSEPSVAEVDGSGRVVFRKEGTVYITAESESGVSGRLMLTYVPVPPEDEKIEVSDSTAENETFILTKTGDAQAQSGSIVVTPPAGFDGEVVYEIVSGDSVSVSENRVTAQHGGFTVVRVTARAESAATMYARRSRSADIWIKEIVLYVDETVGTMRFNFEEDEQFSSAEKEVRLMVSNPTSLEGKIVRYRLKSGASVASVDDAGQLRFTGPGEVTVVAEVFYDAEKFADVQGNFDFGAVLASKEIRLTCLYGGAETFVLRRQGSTVAADDLFETEVGASLVFTIDKNSFRPSDFVLTEEKISVDAGGSAALGVEVDVQAGTITFKGIQGTFAVDGEAGYIYVNISIGGKNLRIQIKVNAYADTLEVQAGLPSQEGSVRQVAASGEYTTLSENISFRISLRRKDGLALTDSRLHWYFGAESGVLDMSVTDTLRLEGLAAGEKNDLRLVAENGLDFAFSLERLQSLQDFGMAFRYTKNTAGSSSQFTAALIESAAQAQGEQSAEISLPEGVQSFFAYILLPDSYLGDFTVQEFESLFPLANTAAFTATYAPDLAMIEFRINNGQGMISANVQMQHGDIVLNFRISRSDLKNIAFGSKSVSFDMNDTSMDGAVYKGLQQVRLFAKHSYYGEVVDYVKVPFSAEGSIDAVYWSFVPYSGDIAGETRTVQVGRTVISGGNEYTIGQDKIPAGISWADPYTEPGYVRIYFGDFDGLSEEDIQKDNFGNFDGGSYTPVNAADPGTFLQISANDGTQGGVGTYYNFNVLNDVGVKVVNVFDANGFYNNSAFVLHTNLYSSTDKPENAADTAVLSDKSKSFGKSFIYGNGYQINYTAKSEDSSSWQDPNGEQKANIGVGRAYNVTLKGKDAKVSDGSKRHAVFSGTYFKYCKIMACYKGIYTSGNTYYIENCVFQYMDDMAVQLSNAEGKVYLKNIVLIDSNKGLENQKEAFYLDGFIDAFNYKAEEDLSSLGISSGKNEILDTAKGFVETLNGKPFFNLVIAFSKSGAKTRPLYLWDGSKISDDTGWMISDYISLKRVYGTNGFFGLGAVGVWTYVYAENMPADAYRISLQCQGTSWDGSENCLVENTVHLAWHMNRCYRDHALAGWDINNHAEHLQSTLA